MKDGKVTESQECRIIQHLLKEHLIKVGEREGGWTKLYWDPLTDSYWEHSYPQGEMQGGGPPALTLLTDEEIETLYGSKPVHPGIGG